MFLGWKNFYGDGLDYSESKKLFDETLSSGFLIRFTGRNDSDGRETHDEHHEWVVLLRCQCQKSLSRIWTTFPAEVNEPSRGTSPRLFRLKDLRVWMQHLLQPQRGSEHLPCTVKYRWEWIDPEALHHRAGSVQPAAVVDRHSSGYRRSTRLTTDPPATMGLSHRNVFRPRRAIDGKIVR